MYTPSDSLLDLMIVMMTRAASILADEWLVVAQDVFFVYLSTLQQFNDFIKQTEFLKTRILLHRSVRYCISSVTGGEERGVRPAPTPQNPHSRGTLYCSPILITAIDT